MRRRHAGQRVWDASQLEAWERVGLVGHWVFTGSGLIVPDRSGYGRVGAITGAPSAALGLNGDDHALRFTSGDRVNVGNLSSVAAGEATCAAWLYRTAAAGDTALIFSDIASNGQGYFGFEVDRTANKLSMTWGAAVTVTGATAMLLNTWYHVVGKRSGSAGAWVGSVYIDGHLDASAATATNPTAGAGAWGIASSPGYAGNYVRGVIGPLKVWNRALTDAEIARLADPSRRILATGRRRVRRAAAAGAAQHWFVLGPTL